ncbi:MAG: YqjK-like family protein [Rhodocyclaceae bacterium]|jgi:hypothetical protein|nr:YqjK-like family protein [Rhodocyclaceae bacterium]
MNPAIVELALRKQRLQLRSEAQRTVLLEGLAVADGVLGRVDRLRDGAHWLKTHAPAVTTFAAVLLLMRPRFTLRWLRRGFVGYQLFRRAKARLEPILAGRP